MTIPSLLALVNNPILRVYVIDEEYNLFHTQVNSLHPYYNPHFVWLLMQFLILDIPDSFLQNITQAGWPEVEKLLLHYLPTHLIYCPLLKVKGQHYMQIEIRRREKPLE